MELVILPPWWRNGWFMVLAAAGLIALVFFAARAWTLRQQERSRRLEALVRERTRELEESREQLRIQATYDALTGVLNRGAILQRLAEQMERSRRKRSPLIVALADVDHFKSINDEFGHLAGDDALRNFATALRTAIRTYDSVGRYGGEEFLLVLTEVPAELAAHVLERLHGSISNLRLRMHQTDLTLTCSIGATLYEPDEGLMEIEGLLALADQALYAAKDAGRNRLVLSRAAERVGDAVISSEARL